MAGDLSAHSGVIRAIMLVPQPIFAVHIWDRRDKVDEEPALGVPAGDLPGAVLADAVRAVVGGPEVDEDVRYEVRVDAQLEEPPGGVNVHVDPEAGPERHGDGDVDEQHDLQKVPESRKPGLRVPGPCGRGKAEPR